MKVSKIRMVTMSLLLFSACGDDSSETADAGPSSDAIIAPDGDLLGPIVYVDATNGDDNNDGATPESAWQSLSKVSAQELDPFTTIRLKRGEVWFDQLTITQSDISVGSYGEGELPMIDGSIPATVWVDEGNGIYSSVVAFGDDEGLANITRDGVMLSPLNWSVDAATTFVAAANGTYSFEYFSKTMYIKTSTPPAGSDLRVSIKFYGIRASNIDRVHIEEVAIRRFGLNGIEFQSCSGCSVSNVNITNGGGAVISFGGKKVETEYLYAGNGIELDHASVNCTVDDVILTDIFDSCISPQTYIDDQAGSNHTYSNMTLERCGFAGVEISILKSENATGSSLENISIIDSTIRDMGKGWSGRRYDSEGHGIRIQADTGAGTIDGMVVRNVTIEGSAGDGIHIGGETGTTTIQRSSIQNNAGVGVVVVGVAGVTTPFLQLETSVIADNGGRGVQYSCASCQGFNIFHNSLYNNTQINLGVSGQDGEANIKNNLFAASGTMTHFFAEQVLINADIDNNCYKEGVNMFGYVGSAFSTLSTFTAATTFEANGVTGTIGLTDPSAGDYSLANSSVCKDSGATGLGVVNDAANFPFASPPSSGALQFR